MNAIFKTFLALIRFPGHPGISLAMFLSGIASSFAVPYTSLFGATEAHMTPIRFGIFMTLTAVSSVIVSTYLGRIADRRSDKKRIVLLSIAGSALGYALLCVTRNYVLLTIFGCVFLSIGAAVFPQLFTFGKARRHAEGIEHTELPDGHLAHHAVLRMGVRSGGGCIRGGWIDRAVHARAQDL